MANTTHERVIVKKPWGYEVIIENSKESNICLKILVINPNSAFSWQYHKNKTEVFFITKGTPKLYYGRTSNKEEAEVILLSVGDSFKIWPGQWHQLESSNEATEIYECSTYHEDSDTYRE